MVRTTTGGLRRRHEMLRRPAALLFAALAACLAGHAAAGEPVRMRHVPAEARAWEPLDVAVELLAEIDPARIATADVVVLGDDGVERSWPLAMSRNALLGEIPAARGIRSSGAYRTTGARANPSHEARTCRGVDLRAGDATIGR